MRAAASNVINAWCKHKRAEIASFITFIIDANVIIRYEYDNWYKLQWFTKCVDNFEWKILFLETATKSFSYTVLSRKRYVFHLQISFFCWNMNTKELLTQIYLWMYSKIYCVHSEKVWIVVQLIWFKIIFTSFWRRNWSLFWKFVNRTEHGKYIFIIENSLSICHARTCFIEVSLFNFLSDSITNWENLANVINKHFVYLTFACACDVCLCTCAIVHVFNTLFP